MEQPQQSSKPQWEEGRYITLMGDPIKSDGKVFDAVTKTDLQSIVGGITCGGTVDVYNDTFPMAAFSYSLIAYGVSRFVRLRNSDNLQVVFGSALETKCIDTCPDEHTIPTSDRYALQAELVRDFNLRAGAAECFIGGVVIATFSFMGGMTGAIGGTNGFIPFLVNRLDMYQRFNKVAAGEWVIVDWPEPKKAEDLVLAADMA